jgi:hypothetical protein
MHTRPHAQKICPTQTQKSLDILSDGPIEDILRPAKMNAAKTHQGKPDTFLASRIIAIPSGVRPKYNCTPSWSYIVMRKF